MSKRKVIGVDMDGKQIGRETKLALTHFWQSRYTRSDDWYLKSNGSNVAGMTGFASSEELARKAAASETNRCIKWLRKEGIECTEPVFHIVPVTVL